jgi:GNAT superfamily N-acetyltransferase
VRDAAAAPPAGVAIRCAAERDIEDLVALLEILFGIEKDFHADPERQRRGLALLLADPERCCVLIGERDGRVLGMVTGQLVVSTAEGGLSALVEDMVVDAPSRGRGVGRRLLEAIEAWARERGATRLQLLADRDNTGALRFYERMAWRRTGLVALRRGGS